jgi:hypothetical protein
MKVGFFLHFDFTMEGMLFNELRCYNTIFNNPNIEKIYIFDYKGKYAHMCKDFDFEYTRVLVSNVSDVEKFKKVDLLFTWDWYQDFFAGTISPKAVDLYKIMSKVSNEFNLKTYFRICDSKHFMKDYKYMITDRANDTPSGRKFAERNAGLLHALDDIQNINYENVYFLCNGSRTVSDWSWVTLTHSMPFLEKAYVQEHSVYLSDDILFRYEECYEQMNHLRGDTEKIDMLYHVGNLNGGKVKKLKAAMKNSEIDLFLRTPARSINNGLRKTTQIKMHEEPIYRDQMYTELNQYAAYLFVGKGDDVSYYFNKTLYDASIGRTVFLIYGDIDKENIYHELSDYVFNNATELKEKYEWIKENYQSHLDKQRDVLIRNLSTEAMDIFLDETEHLLSTNKNRERLLEYIDKEK